MKWASEHRWWLLGGVLVAALVAGLSIYLRKPTTTQTTKIAEAKTENVQAAATVTKTAGPVKVTKRKTTPTPQGPVVEETTIERAPVTTTTATTVEAQRTESVRVETKTVTVDRPSWRLTGSARWDSFKPQPSEVSIGLSRRVLGPVYLGAEVAADPNSLSKPRVAATISLELP